MHLMSMTDTSIIVCSHPSSTLPVFKTLNDRHTVITPKPTDLIHHLVGILRGEDLRSPRFDEHWDRAQTSVDGVARQRTGAQDVDAQTAVEPIHVVAEESKYLNGKYVNIYKV